ncbi:MAG: hypothetical protein IJW50_04635 [Clostridia bacterium]|nr:hypothetical protein [Clostridia bacterium]
MSNEVQVSYVDLTNISNSIARTAAAVSALQSQTTQIGNNLITVNDNVVLVDRKVNQVDSQLADLRDRFVKMVKEQRMAAALQRALTEIIRIRQELEQKYGSYQLVRNTMLGILQATDLALVRNDTIATASEQLMISTPKYWLAPCVVALSAWIADNKELADRALKEALNRDKEKTALVFALVCRRAANTDDEKVNHARNLACYKWLNMYFGMQKAKMMRSSIIVYINAYVNGVFGDPNSEEIKQTCDFYSYVDQWMKEIDENGSLAAEQAAYWAQFYQSRCVDINETYPTLAKVCPEFERINAYVKRINAVDEIFAHFEGIANASVDKTKLANMIDNELLTLVSKFDDEEAPLREEEELMSEIKRLKGDEELAKRIIQARKIKRADPPINFAEQLTQAITSGDQSGSLASARKTSCAFLSKYIVPAYHKFIGEKRDDFPQEITVKVDDWKGNTTDGANKGKMKEDYTAHVNKKRDAELATIKSPTAMLIIALVLAVVGAICFAVDAAPVAIIGLICAVVVFVFWNKKNGKAKADKLAINNKYDQIVNNGCSTIEKAANEWIAILALVNGFVPCNIGDLDIMMIEEAK